MVRTFVGVDSTSEIRAVDTRINEHLRTLEERAGNGALQVLRCPKRYPSSLTTGYAHPLTRNNTPCVVHSNLHNLVIVRCAIETGRGSFDHYQGSLSYTLWPHYADTRMDAVRVHVLIRKKNTPTHSHRSDPIL